MEGQVDNGTQTLRAHWLLAVGVGKLSQGREPRAAAPPQVLGRDASAGARGTFLLFDREMDSEKLFQDCGRAVIGVGGAVD